MSLSSPTSLSIIVPVFNEENTIGEILKRLGALPCEKQIIVVDNGSSDKTAERISEAAHSTPLISIYYDKIQGKGAAILAGLAQASGEYVVIQDGDLEYDPQDIALMLELARREKAGAVFGSRNLNPSSGVSYKRYYWGGRALTWLANVLFGVGISDEATCYKMIRRDILLQMNLSCRRFEFCPEVVAKLGLAGVRIHEIPISYSPRSMDEGKKIRWTDGAEAVWTLLKWYLVGSTDIAKQASRAEQDN